MSGLVLKLGPNERVLVNGAVIENGSRRSKLNILTPKANILRLRDAIHPHEANTPVSRVCYILQLVLSGDEDLSEAGIQVKNGLNQLAQVFTDSESRSLLGIATENIENEKVYPALKALRELLLIEKNLFRDHKK